MPVLVLVLIVVLVVVLVLLSSGGPVRQDARRLEALERRVALLEHVLRERLPLLEVRQQKLVDLVPIDPVSEEELEAAQRRWDARFLGRDEH